MKTNILSLILSSLLTGFAFLQPAQAVVPPPDGGYPGGNTAEGTSALLSLGPNGFNNTAIGFMSLTNNTQGDANTAVGAGALFSNRGQGQNTATGAGALFSSNGDNNTANGAFALYSNSIGSGNTAMGSNALYSNRIAFANTAVVMARFLVIPAKTSPKAQATRPSASRRSTTTQRAMTILPWAVTPVGIEPRAITISISAT